jgi:hypothetical protein
MRCASTIIRVAIFAVFALVVVLHLLASGESALDHYAILADWPEGQGSELAGSIVSALLFIAALGIAALVAAWFGFVRTYGRALVPGFALLAIYSLSVLSLSSMPDLDAEPGTSADGPTPGVLFYLGGLWLLACLGVWLALRERIRSIT